jgi:hypothetical protein
MNHMKLFGVFFFCWALAVADMDAANKKPDFSGTWQLDKSMSDLKYSAPVSERASHQEGGRSMGSGRMGGSGMGGGGLESPGMSGNSGGSGRSGGGRGRGGIGGGRGAGGAAMGGISAGGPLKDIPVIDSYGIGSVADKLIIVHTEPSLNIEKDFQLGQGEQTRKFDLTTDGKTVHKSSADGNSYQAKTQWSGTQLVTRSEVKTPMGSLEVVETRRLSDDERILTIHIKSKDHASNWSGTAVYTRMETVGKTEK